MCLLWIFPEVIDFAVGVGHQVGILLEAEVILQDGGDQEGQLGVSGVCGVFEVVLAIAIGVIEQAAFGRVDEAVSLLQSLEIDDRDLLEHLAGAGRKVIAYIPEMVEPELMYKLFSGVVGTLDALAQALK